jgi:drug/metabolite transporter (DMT)-like permease
MTSSRRLVFGALVAAGLLWGTTVPLSKVALEWLPPAWLAVARFAVAAAVLLAVSRPGWRGAFRPAVLVAGGLGYGASVVLQNLGLQRTSVTHAALIVGTSPMLIAVIAALWHRTVTRPAAWAGFAVSLAGVGLIAGGRGGGATLGGDALVMAAQVVCATFTVAQNRLLPGRDPVAVTGAQFLAAALATAPVALATERFPALPAGSAPLLAFAGLALCGTALPFSLFAFGQTRVPAGVAGAFLNLEPLVGALAGAVVFADPVTRIQVVGGAAILAGIALSGLPSVRRRRRAAALPAPLSAAARPDIAAQPAVSGSSPGQRTRAPTSLRNASTVSRSPGLNGRMARTMPVSSGPKKLQPSATASSVTRISTLRRSAALRSRRTCPAPSSRSTSAVVDAEVRPSCAPSQPAVAESPARSASSRWISARTSVSCRPLARANAARARSSSTEIARSRCTS